MRDHNPFYILVVVIYYKIIYSINPKNEYIYKIGFSIFKKLVGENIYRFRFLKNEKIGGRVNKVRNSQNI